MNYTKFIKHKKYYTPQSPNKTTKKNFEMVLNDEKIKLSMQILKDIKKTKILLENYIRISNLFLYTILILDSNFDIDEYIAYFIKDKNEFINEFSEYLNSPSCRNLNIFYKKNYLVVLEILKNHIDEILKIYKNLKQVMLKKMRKKENFWKIKQEYIKSAKENTTSITGNISNLSSSLTSMPSKLPIKLLNPFKTVKEQENKNSINSNKAPIAYPTSDLKIDNEELYKDNLPSLNIFKESENKSLEKTKNILFELSDLMTNFSTKVMQHQEITQNSKILILINSF